MTGPLKWHGGKAYLAKKIIALFPPRCPNPNAPAADDRGYLHYVEPYFGGGSVLLANNPEGISEVANDLNKTLAIFWAVLKSDELFPQFMRRIESTPFSEWFWKHAGEYDKIDEGICLDIAVDFFVTCRQSLAGRMDAFAPRSRSRTRRGMNEQVSAWLNAVEGLPAVHARLKRVLLLDQPALAVIKAEDGPRTLFYLDPPYMHETRATTKEYGQYEMYEKDHHELLHLLSQIDGCFLLSGYRSDLYDDFAKSEGWNRVDFKLPNNAAGGDKKRIMTECVWRNYE